MNQPTDNNSATAELLPGAAFSPAITIPDAFINALESGQEITAAHVAVAASLELPAAVTALPEHFKFNDLEHYLPQRRRARGTMTTAYVQPFADYTASYAGHGAVVFVDAEQMTATAVLDLGTIEKPGHTDNRAQLAPKKTAAYAALLGINGNLANQQTLAEFIEDWFTLAHMTFANEQGEVTPAQALAAIRRITIETARKVDNEEKALSASRTAFESVAATSAEPIPTAITFTCKPYADLQPRTFTLRLSILTNNSKPLLVLRIQNLETHVEQMGGELAHLVRTAIKGALPVLMGSYSKAS